MVFQGANDPLQSYASFGSYDDWWNSLTPNHQFQAGWLSQRHDPNDLLNQAASHFGMPAGYYQPVGGGEGLINQQVNELASRNWEGNRFDTSIPYGGAQTAYWNTPEYQARRDALSGQGLSNSQMRSTLRNEFSQPAPQPSPQPTQQPSPQPTQQPTTQPASQGLLSSTQPNPWTGLVGNGQGGYQVPLFQNFNEQWLRNPAAPEKALLGSYLNAGDTLNVPSNFMGNVPDYGQIQQQAQWNGYFPQTMRWWAGPHGISPGFSFANSNSPVNYAGLFGQSNPWWGNPVASPTYPSPSPQSLSPYYGSGPDSHFGKYFQNMRQNAQTLGEQRAEEEQQRVSSQQQAIADMTGCPVDDLQCQARFWIDQGGG